jgi:hypothetical protein
MVQGGYRIVVRDARESSFMRMDGKTVMRVWLDPMVLLTFLTIGIDVHAHAAEMRKMV